ncbi:DUF4129 domain-containing protein [Mycobacterium sp.]|uniref:DUF4129 domain-containing protein n=1 Tax=Mycobacterium sp. TaxID=1785 RepID=UPI003A87B524
MPFIDIDRDTAHDAAQRELAKPIYPRQGVRDGIVDKLNELLTQLLQQISTVPGQWFTITALLLLVTAAVATALGIARRTIHTRNGHALFDNGQLTAAQYRIAAEHCAAECNWNAAIRHRLRAVARGLEEDRVLTAAPGRTAIELANDAGAIFPRLRRELHRAAGIFNDVAYGQQPGTRSSYEMIAGLDAHLRSHPGSTSVPARPPTPASWVPVR